MLTYKLIERGNPRDIEAPKKFYATHVNKGKKSLKDISVDIEDRSSLSRGDISNVLDNLVDQIPKYLLDGQSVQLGDLGTFRLSLSSDGVDTPEVFNTGMIKNLKIIFTPGTMLKDELTKASYSKL